MEWPAPDPSVGDKTALTPSTLPDVDRIDVDIDEQLTLDGAHEAETLDHELVARHAPTLSPRQPIRFGSTSGRETR